VLVSFILVLLVFQFERRTMIPSLLLSSPLEKANQQIARERQRVNEGGQEQEREQRSIPNPCKVALACQDTVWCWR
jgi:hypothetical protein